MLIVMQFGEIDIDSELVASVQRLDGKEEQRIMMLNNGCLCCTVREDLVGMLNELVSKAPEMPLPVAETQITEHRSPSSAAGVRAWCTVHAHALPSW